MADYRRKRWQSEMAVRVDVNGALDAVVGDGGIRVESLEELAPRAAEVHASLAARRRGKELRFPDLPFERSESRRIVELARDVRAEFDTLVVLGIGGSALGARALYGALRPPFHGCRPGSEERGARLIVADNVDPRTFAAILDEVDPHRTAFNVISKSGETVETMSEFLIVRERLLKVLGAVDYTRRVIVTTDTASGPLRQIVNDEGFRSLAIPPSIVGAYSMLTAVGLFPAAVAGIDVAELLAGAAAMDERCRSESLFENPAYLHGAVQYLAASRHGKGVRVIMPYADALGGLADWFVQLWAEGLSGGREVDGARVATGQTPLRARGASDQHSLLQLLLEGPNDKMVTLVRVEDHGLRMEIPTGYADLEAVGYLGGRALGEILNLEERATEISLAKRGRMTTTLHVPAVNPFTVGQLVSLLQTETVFTAALLGVDPFRQPSIEAGRRLSHAMAGRRGLEGERVEIEGWMQKKSPRFVI